MKRTLRLAALLAVLALPATASGDAGTTPSAGGDQLGTATTKSPRAAQVRLFQVGFVLRSRNGKPVSIRKFRYRGLPVRCPNGSRRARGKIRRIKVKGGKRFAKTVQRRGKTVRVKGRVRRGGAKVSGTIRARGAFGGLRRCDSGKRRWSAS